MKEWNQVSAVLRRGMLCCAMTLVSTTLIHAAAYRPSDPNQILEQLPRGFPQATARDKTTASDPDATLEQIQKLLEYAYLQGDPRALGQASALLQQQAAGLNDLSLMMLRAQAAQANHQFDEATALLVKLKQLSSDHVDADLQLASIALVGGQFAQARQHCEQIRGLDVLAIRLICLAQVDAMSGQLRSTAAKLSALEPMLSSFTKSQQLWVLLIQADIALRLDDAALNARVFSRLPTNHIPALMARADWLMAHQEWQQVHDLLKDHTEHDGLLIRLVTSKRQLKRSDAAQYQRLMIERVTQWRQRDDQAHYREQASYALLAESAAQSLALAQKNWLHQRETADFVVYASAALRSKSLKDVTVLLNWAKTTGFEYPIVIKRLTAAALEYAQ